MSEVIRGPVWKQGDEDKCLDCVCLEIGLDRMSGYVFFAAGTCIAAMVRF